MKTSKKGVSVGARVKILPQHWLRAHEEGFIIDSRPQARNNWLVKFDRSYPGGGIEGDKLWLDESQFSEVEHRRSIANAKEGMMESGDFPMMRRAFAA